MKKILLMAFTLLFVFGFYSCNDTDFWTDEGEVTLLDISKVSYDLKMNDNASKPDFWTGDEIGLFVFANQRWEYKKLTYMYPAWKLDSPVWLTNEGSGICAGYPYESGSGQPDSFMIEHITQTDYLFSDLCHVNSSNSVLSLKMMHALSLIEFEFVYEFGFDNPEIGLIDFISIEGIGLSSKAMFNIQSGKIVFADGHQPAQVYGWQLDTPVIYNGKKIGLMVVPVDLVANYGDIFFNFNFNNLKFSWPVPAGTIWERGKRYTYKVVIRGRQLEIINAQIEDWHDAGKESIGLPYYG